MAHYQLRTFILLFCLGIVLVGCGGSSGAGKVATATPGATIDEAGTGAKGLPLYCPEFVTVGPHDTLYVSDNDNSAVHERIIRLSATGQELGEWHLFPAGYIDRMQGPGKIAVDQQGNMYVIDLGRDKVLKVSPMGHIMTSWGSYGSGQEQFRQPVAVAVDSHNNVYVGDNDASSARVEKFTDTGVFLGIVMMQERPQRTNEFTEWYPMGLAVDSSDNLYVASDVGLTELAPTGQMLQKVQITNYTSTVVRIWGGVAFNPHGDLYAIHLTFDGYHFYPRIMQMDMARGTDLKVWNVWEWNKNEVQSMAFDSQGNAYVTESTSTGGAQLQKLSPTGQVIATWQGTCGA